MTFLGKMNVGTLLVNSGLFCNICDAKKSNLIVEMRKRATNNAQPANSTVGGRVGEGEPENQHQGDDELATTASKPTTRKSARPPQSLLQDDHQQQQQGKNDGTEVDDRQQLWKHSLLRILLIFVVFIVLHHFFFRFVVDPLRMPKQLEPEELIKQLKTQRMLWTNLYLGIPPLPQETVQDASFQQQEIKTFFFISKPVNATTSPNQWASLTSLKRWEYNKSERERKRKR